MFVAMAERTKLNGKSVKLNSTESSKDALGESVSEAVKYSLVPDLPLTCNYSVYCV